MPVDVEEESDRRTRVECFLDEAMIISVGKGEEEKEYLKRRYEEVRMLNMINKIKKTSDRKEYM